MIVGASRKLERDAGIVEPHLQLADRLPDLRPCIVVEAGHDVRRAGDTLNPLVRISAGHRQGCFQIGCAVVDTRQQMTMKVEHVIPIALFQRFAEYSKHAQPADEASSIKRCIKRR